ncbi:MAG: glycosyltransferase [Chloroflexi bacterium]|nr:glycosyltransferase [Chloroflexota bacterium]
MYKPHISGVTNYISLNKRELEPAGHKVYVFTLGGEAYEDDELYVVRSPAIPIPDTGYYLGFRYSRAAQRKLGSMDIVHVHHPFVSGRLALRYCRPRGIPIIFTNHTRYDLYAQAYLPMVPEALSETLLHAYMPDFCASCDLVIAPSAGLVKVLRGLGVGSPIEVAPNGVDLRPFEQGAPRSRAEFGLADDDCVLIYLGRVAPEKNLGFLLQAFVGAKSVVENLHLLIVGGGPALESLRDEAGRSGVGAFIRFTGPVPYQDVPGMLMLADAFVTPSLTEVHPLSLIEALAAGLPAIGIESPGVEDTICDGENGLLCANDLAVFTAKLVRLTLDAELRQRLAGGARESAKQYDIRRTSGIMMSHYERLAEERVRRSDGKAT